MLILLVAWSLQLTKLYETTRDKHNSNSINIKLYSSIGAIRPAGLLRGIYFQPINCDRVKED